MALPSSKRGFFPVVSKLVGVDATSPALTSVKRVEAIRDAIQTENKSGQAVMSLALGLPELQWSAGGGGEVIRRQNMHPRDAACMHGLAHRENGYAFCDSLDVPHVHHK